MFFLFRSKSNQKSIFGPKSKLLSCCLKFWILLISRVTMVLFKCRHKNTQIRHFQLSSLNFLIEVLYFGKFKGGDFKDLNTIYKFRQKSSQSSKLRYLGPKFKMHFLSFCKKNVHLYKFKRVLISNMVIDFFN